MIKMNTVVGVLLCALLPLAAQEAEIALPDVTTVVSGDTLTAGKDAVPDYSTVLPSDDTGKIELPQLEKAQSPAAAPSVAANGGTVSAGSAEKNVYAEGQIGGGYPFLFLGDFTVYRATGKAPFNITFSHKSNETFADNKASDGFFSRHTAVGAEKSLITEKSRNTFAASYNTDNYGLQSLSTPFFDMVCHTISASEDSRFTFDNGWNIVFGASGNWYNRYGGVRQALTVTDEDGNELTFDVDDVRADTALLDITPHAGFGWQNDVIDTGFRAQYTLQSNVGDGENFTDYDGTRFRNVSHRGEFGIFGDWKASDYVTLHGSVGLVVGSAMGDSTVVPPFTLGADITIPYSEDSDAVALVSLAGGLQSEQATVRALEKAYRFSYMSVMPAETSDWYGTAAVSVPVPLPAFDAFTVSGGATYRRTAFENGVWAPDYTARRDEAGLYWLESDERTDFLSTLGVRADAGGVTYRAQWEAQWLDLPALADRHSITLGASYEGARFSASAYAREALGASSDKTPEIGASAAVRVSPTLRLALMLTDIVKLLANTTRSYAHSDYATESGSAALVAQFQF